jgi:hypothetical protein
MIQLFANREEELHFLDKHFKSDNAELIVIYGRRRIGKTELAVRFSKNKPHIYFLADRRPETELIQELKRRMSLYLEDESFAKLEVKDWIELFHEFIKWNANKKTIIIIDEFPTLIETNRAVPSIFQKIWDQNLKNTKTMLILLGSSISMMETEVLNYKSPLYGRRTAQWKLEPLKLNHLHKFFPHYTTETLMHVYACLGGVPAYLQKFDPNIDFWNNVEQKILAKGEPLYEEAEFLLREELREPRNYAAILKAIAQGAKTYGEIINLTNMDKSMLSKYTSILEDLNFIKRTYPIAAKPKPRKGLYTIADNYLTFWFKYIYPSKTELETGNTKHVLNIIRKEYNTHLGHVFEETAPEIISEINKKKQLPFTYTTIGKWWFKNNEIDLIAIDEEKQITTFLEVKWSILTKQDFERTITSLKAKTPQFKYNRKKENYGIIAKQINEKQELRQKGYIALDLEDLQPA